MFFIYLHVFTYILTLSKLYILKMSVVNLCFLYTCESPSSKTVENGYSLQFWFCGILPQTWSPHCVLHLLWCPVNGEYHSKRYPRSASDASLSGSRSKRDAFWCGCSDLVSLDNLGWCKVTFFPTPHFCTLYFIGFFQICSIKWYTLILPKGLLETAAPPLRKFVVSNFIFFIRMVYSG